MCMSMEAVKEMNETMEQIQEWKRIKEEAEANITAYIGNICKATLSEIERETVDKAEVKKLLSAKDYQKVSKVSVYPVLRVS